MAFGEFADGFFGDEGGDDAGEEDHDDGAVEDVVGEEAGAIGEEDFVTDEDGGEGSGRLGVAKAEDYLALDGFHSVDFLGDKSG